MDDISPEVVSIADACLGGLQGRSALLIGPEGKLYPYRQLLRQAGMKYVYQEDALTRVPPLISHVNLIISMPNRMKMAGAPIYPQLTAASIARACEGRRTPLLIFDLASSTSVEEMAGLLPAVCLYTPDDIRQMLGKTEAKAS